MYLIRSNCCFHYLLAIPQRFNRMNVRGSTRRIERGDGRNNHCEGYRTDPQPPGEDEYGHRHEFFSISLFLYQWPVPVIGLYCQSTGKCPSQSTTQKSDE